MKIGQKLKVAGPNFALNTYKSIQNLQFLTVLMKTIENGLKSPKLADLYVSWNSLLFRLKPISFRGIMLSQLTKPISCYRSIAKLLQ